MKKEDSVFVSWHSLRKQLHFLAMTSFCRSGESTEGMKLFSYWIFTSRLGVVLNRCFFLLHYFFFSACLLYWRGISSYRDGGGMRGCFLYRVVSFSGGHLGSSL